MNLKSGLQSLFNYTELKYLNLLITAVTIV